MRGIPPLQKSIRPAALVRDPVETRLGLVVSRRIDFSSCQNGRMTRYYACRTHPGEGDMNKRGIVGAIAITLCCGVACGQSAPGRAPAASPAPAGKAGYFANSDLQEIWKDLKARQVLKKRVLEGGSHSINIRVVRPTDQPLVHSNSLDIWLVSAGSATAVTGGELLDVKKRPNSDDAAGTSIQGGIEQPLKAGDVLYVPPGVAHGFKDIQGFRASRFSKLKSREFEDRPFWYALRILMMQGHLRSGVLSSAQPCATK
jgi:mannose-6-phosphate isomerase-like protein (cupin superfamily)